jgi:hypothetical protein
MKENLQKINYVGKGNYNWKMEIIMKDNGRMINVMDLVFMYVKMVHVTKEM